MPASKPIPEGRGGILAHLVVNGAAKAIDFYKKAFGAEEISRSPTPDGSKIMHAELRIASSVFMLCDDFPEYGGCRDPQKLGASPVTLHQYVRDVDAAMKRATDAGAKVTMPAMDMFWGDRYGKIKDPFGHEWSLATHLRDVSPEECTAAAKAFFSGHGKGDCGGKHG
jgi:uncharacterized glyoxalase superfamily protein PhnB